MTNIVNPYSKNWLELAMSATDIMDKSSMLTIERFIEVVNFNIDKYTLDKFFLNIQDDLPMYLDDSTIEWFGYRGVLKNQKGKIRLLLQNNFAEDENKLWFEYSNKDYVTFYEENPNKLIYPHPDDFKGKNRTKHMVVHPDIFKHLILMAQTNKAHEIRSYYITLEKLVKLYSKYQSYMMTQYEIARRERAEADNLSLLDKLNKLISDTSDANQKLIMSSQTLNVMNQTLESMNQKLDISDKKLTSAKKTIKSTHKIIKKILPDKVRTADLTVGDCQYVYIIRDNQAPDDEHNFYFMRTQRKSYPAQMKKLKEKFGDHLRRWFVIKQPNAVTFWKSIRTELKDNIDKDSKSNWFSLVDMSRAQFKTKIKELDAKRMSAYI